MLAQSSQTLIGKRYQLLDKLGEGGMGVVYRAHDRLNRQTVALKRVNTPADSYDLRVDESMTIRLALAHEFQMLSSLHHPNVINVLDYGFDADKQPYFTMNLLENPQPITAAGAEKSVAAKVELLIQMLQALAYLHRRGVVHRDLKPDNALVTQEGEVKVLDFGLAVLHEQKRPEEEIAGTLAYMAPEVLQGHPVSEASDLYSVGVIAYELFAGQHPYNVANPGKLVQDIFQRNADIDVLDIDQDLADIVQRLLAKSPGDRYQDVYAVLKAFIEAADHPLPKETAAIRESFLQAARFVGRERELAQLTGALNQTVDDTGSAWLIGGESGVGKSRLLNELRTLAQVRGVLVLNGQAVTGAGLLYQLWRDPLRRLLLSTDLDDMDASILKQILPDIGDLLGREVSDAPELEGAAGQERLLATIASLFQKQSQPAMLVLEDLQWTAESLDVLKLLIPLTQQVPLLIVASYRDDERPDLPAELPGMQTLHLERLSDDGIAQLSESMLGSAGKQPHVLRLLKKETEGNVFFLVEVVRALAEEAGGLGDVGRLTLPERVLAGGVQQVVQRRLNRVPPEARPLLNITAVAGRFLDLKLLHQLAPDVDLDDWLTACSAAAVLEVIEEQWGFAHDKLREGLLAAMKPDVRRDLHAQIAQGLEQVYVDSSEYSGMIADHYEQAGELTQATGWFIRAGQHAQVTYALEQATHYYQKVLSFWRQGIAKNSDHPSGEMIQFNLGRVLMWQAQYAQAAEAFRGMQTAAEDAGDVVSQARAWRGIAESQFRLGDLKASLDSAGRAEDLARSVNARPELAKALWMKGWTYYRLGDPEAVLKHAEEVLAISTELDDQRQMAESANLLGAAHYALGNYRQTELHFEKAMESFQNLGERGDAMSLLNNLGVLAAARGEYQLAFTRYQNALSVARELGMRDAEIVYLSNLGGARAGLGDYSAAESDLQQVIHLVGGGSLSELSETYRFLAEAYLGQNQLEAAREAALQALTLGRALESAEYVANAWRVLGEVVGRSGVPALVEQQSYDAPACFAESRRICEETGMEGERARTLRAWATYELAHGDKTKGAALWQEARDIFTRLGADHEVTRMETARKG